MENEIAENWKRFREGDQKSFTNLFALTSNRLFCYGMKFTNDEELVKDCIQDLFLKIFQARLVLPPIDNPMFYLLTSLKNILIDTLSRVENITYFSPQQMPFYVTFIYGPDEEGNEADDETKERFDQAVALLSERQKEAIYLRYQSELSYDEIAKLLNINYQSARNLIHRAIEKIRKKTFLQ